MKTFLLLLVVASFGLAGCIAVPVDGGYGYGPRHGYGGGRGDYNRDDYGRRDYSRRDYR